MKFNGIDVYSNNSVVVISDQEDRLVYQRRLPNDLGQILAALAPHRAELLQPERIPGGRARRRYAQFARQPPQPVLLPVSVTDPGA